MTKPHPRWRNFGLLVLVSYFGCVMGIALAQHPKGGGVDPWNPLNVAVIIVFSVSGAVVNLLLAAVLSLSGHFVFLKWHESAAVVPFLGFALLSYLIFASGSP